MSFIHTHKKNILIVLILSICVVAILFFQFFKNPFFYFAADNSELYFPFWIYLNKALHSGFFPLLNPYWFGGSLPMGAIESTIFYPPSLISQLFFNPNNGLNTAYLIFFANEIAHYIIGAIGFYLLLRDGLKLNSFSSIFGAIIYIGSGSFIGRFVHFIVIITLAWLPFLYWTYIRFIDTKKTKYAIGTILSLVLIITGSHPQFTYYVFIFYGILVLFSTITALKKDKLFIFICSSMLIVLSCLLTAPKLLLTFELSRNIIHSTLETSVANLYNSLHPLYFLTLFVPYLFGKHQIGYWGSQYPWGNWDNYIYIGIVPFFFFTYVLFWRNKRLLFIFSINLLIVILFLLGKYNPISVFLNQKLPLAESISMISKMTVLFHFFICILSSIGISMFVNLINKRKTIILSAILSIIFISVLFWLSRSYKLLHPVSNGVVPSLIAQEFAKKNIILATNLLYVSIAVIACTLIFKQKKILYLLLIVFAIDIFMNGGIFNPIESAPGSPDRYFGENSIVEQIKKDSDVFRVHNLWPRNINMIQSIETTGGYHTIETKSYHALVPYMETGNFFDLLNVKYAISEKQPGSRFVNIQSSLWLNTSYLDRISFIPFYQLAPSEEDAISLITSDEYKPREQIVLINNAENKKVLTDFVLQNKSNSIKKISESKILIKELTSDSITSEVYAPQNGFILFSQFQYPGWKSKVDGKEIKLLKANGFQYAIPINKGNHTVEFFFQSTPFFIGIIIQIVTLFGVSIIAILKKFNLSKLVLKK